MDKTFMLLGKPLSYWVEVDRKLHEQGYGRLIQEITDLRARVSFYESRIKEMMDFKEKTDEE